MTTTPQLLPLTQQIAQAVGTTSLTIAIERGGLDTAGNPWADVEICNGVPIAQAVLNLRDKTARFHLTQDVVKYDPTLAPHLGLLNTTLVQIGKVLPGFVPPPPAPGAVTPTSASNAPVWPDPPHPNAYHGLAGRMVAAIMPHTEADPVAVLVSFLTAFGIAAGTSPHFFVGATRHVPRLFTALVGKSSKARKGDSWQPVNTLFALADLGTLMPTLPTQSGLSSGEGLIWAVRDPIEKTEPIKQNRIVTGYQTVVVDPGVADKRLLVIEAEFARVLRVMGRQGNTLSATLRDAWDTGMLSSMTKNMPARAKGAHIGLIGHVTKDELLRELTDTESANGFGNRFLWFAVRRTGNLPEPAAFSGPAVDALATELTDRVLVAQQTGEMTRDAAARDLWRDVYADLAGERDGLHGALTARAEAQVLRLSMLYALLDGSPAIGVGHLGAALELWDYADRSAAFLFGDALGDPVADTILAALNQAGEMTRTQISDLFKGHERSERIALALQLLLQRGKVRMTTRFTGGRPVEVWTAV